MKGIAPSPGEDAGFFQKHVVLSILVQTTTCLDPWIQDLVVGIIFKIAINTTGNFFISYFSEGLYSLQFLDCLHFSHTYRVIEAMHFDITACGVHLLIDTLWHVSIRSTSTWLAMHYSEIKMHQLFE